jgi:hypothetical protein
LSHVQNCFNFSLLSVHPINPKNHFNHFQNFFSFDRKKSPRPSEVNCFFRIEKPLCANVYIFRVGLFFQMPFFWKKMWALLNGIMDYVINRLTKSILSKWASPKELFLPKVCI